MCSGSCVSRGVEGFLGLEKLADIVTKDNIRYAFDVCLYSYPDAVASGTINSPCNIDGACAPLEDALETSLLRANKDNQFDYCKAESSIIESTSYKDCISCLKSTSSQKYLANCELSTPGNY